MLGIEEGWADGSREGIVDGECEIVGPTDGFDDGASLGDIDGMLDGVLLGT